MLLRLNLSQLIESKMHLGNEAGSWDKGYSYFMERVFQNKVLIDLEVTLLAMRKSSKLLSAVIKGYGLVGFSDSSKNVLHWIKLFSKKWGQIVFWGYWFPGTLTNYRKFWSGRYLYRDKWRIKRNSVCINFFKFPSIFVLSSVKRSYDVLFECLKFKIPTIGFTDSNVRPYGVLYMIPGNDSSEFSLGLFYLNILGALSTGFCMRRTTFLQKVLSLAVKRINSKRIKRLLRRTNRSVSKLAARMNTRESVSTSSVSQFSFALYRRILHYFGVTAMRKKRQSMRGRFFALRRSRMIVKAKRKLLPYSILLSRYGTDSFNLLKTETAFFQRQKNRNELFLLRSKKYSKKFKFKKLKKWGLKLASFQKTFKKVYKEVPRRLFIRYKKRLKKDSLLIGLNFIGSRVYKKGKGRKRRKIFRISFNQIQR
jgi:ribosomal protein S2